MGRVNRRAEATIGVAEIGDRIERYVGDGLAEHDMEDQQIVDRRPRITESLGEGVRPRHGEPPAEQSGIERDVAGGDRARGGVADDLADAEIFKKIAGTIFRHGNTFTVKPSAKPGISRATS